MLDDWWSALPYLASQTQIPLNELNNRMVGLHRLSGQKREEKN
jgi:hypothetical protein